MVMPLGKHLWAAGVVLFWFVFLNKANQLWCRAAGGDGAVAAACAGGVRHLEGWHFCATRHRFVSLKPAVKR